MFHADPHAGNLLYDRRRGELVILDWALTEHLSRAERPRLAMLFVMIFLRDPVGASDAILALSPEGGRREKSKARRIRDSVTRFLNQLPVKHIPGAVDPWVCWRASPLKAFAFPLPWSCFVRRYSPWMASSTT